jgi:hypothetical protein
MMHLYAASTCCIYVLHPHHRELVVVQLARPVKLESRVGGLASPCWYAWWPSVHPCSAASLGLWGGRGGGLGGGGLGGGLGGQGGGGGLWRMSDASRSSPLIPTPDSSSA